MISFLLKYSKISPGGTDFEAEGPSIYCRRRPIMVGAYALRKLSCLDSENRTVNLAVKCVKERQTWTNKWNNSEKKRFLHQYISTKLIITI